MDSNRAQPDQSSCLWLHDFQDLLRATEDLDRLRKNFGAVNPRPDGWRNQLIQLAKRAMARSLDWYTRPLDAFNSSAARSIGEMATALDSLYMTVLALDRVLAAQIPMRIRFPSDRTAYVVGLFGSGRLYVSNLIRLHIGDRAKWYRDTIRVHPGPTPMIYSGHATLKYFSAEQASPEVTKNILNAVRSGFADLIFMYRHPLDSLLTNWIWWRTYIRDRIRIPGITRYYKDTSRLCADLDANFPEFMAFAEGDPAFFAAIAPSRFLSFAEFVEESELYLQCAALALRLEDFMADPLKEFAKIAGVMSVNPDLSQVSLRRPDTKAFGYLQVKEKVPRFREFIDQLDGDITRRINRLGFDV